MISVIIVQYNKVELTQQAIRSFQHFHRDEHEIILVDNASTDPALGTLKEEFPWIQIIFNKKNVGFGAANNIGAKIAKGDILLFLNNDTLTISQFTTMIEREFSQNPAMGVLGPRLLNEDRSFQLSAGSLPTFFGEIGRKMIYDWVESRNKIAEQYVQKKYRREQTVGWVTGAALFIRRELFIRLGGFDETMFMYFEDIDLCLRAGRESTVLYFPESFLVHLKGGSAAGKSHVNKIYRQSQLRYYEKHRPFFERLLLMLYLRLSSKIP